MPQPTRLTTIDGHDAMDDTADAAKVILQANSGVDIGDVDILSIAAGTNRIGTFSGVSKTISVTKALIAATDYAAEDVLSEHATSGTVWTFAAIFRANNTGGYITKAIASLETTALTPKLTLYLFNVAPTSNLNDNVANTAVLNADIGKYVGRIDFPALEDLGGNSESVITSSTSGNLPMWVDAASAADDLIGICVTRDAITGESAGDDLTIKLTLEQF